MAVAVNCKISNEVDIHTLIAALYRCESNARANINLTPSENVLSPLAKLPFLLDVYSRYFLDDMRLFGKWYFPNGERFSEIETDILVPLLTEMSGAQYVNVRPISGINCMTVALAALTHPGDTIFIIPREYGGHASTAVVAKRLGLDTKCIPFSNTYDVDYERFASLLAKGRTSLIYIDQATLLFPIDPKPIRQLVDTVSPDTRIHYDSSHLNGLIINRSIFNPLLRGAHCYGGSTHKTLPGPHKGFLATNDPSIAHSIQEKADHFVSHHHPASVISLAITLLEMKYCNGYRYGECVMQYAKVFAEELVRNDFYVAAQARGYTGCHQVWSYPIPCTDIDVLTQLLTEIGIIINRFDRLPGIDRPAYRLSVAEFTRLGANIDDIKILVSIMSSAMHDLSNIADLKERVTYLRKKLCRPSFCFGIDMIEENVQYQNAPELLKNLCRSLFLYG